jgi:hypothetical protein
MAAYLASTGAPCHPRRMPPTSIKIDRARYVITVDDQRRIIRDGSILVEQGTHHSRGPRRRAWPTRGPIA